MSPRVRAAYALTLPVLCPFCYEPVMPGQPFDLDHVIPRAHGGTVADGLRPAHVHCNRKAGKGVRHNSQRAATHSRVW